MTIFSRKLSDQEKDTKFVGVHLPLPLNEYFVLYSLATDTPKSNIVHALIEDWKIKEEKEMDERELIELLVDKAINVYTTQKKKRRGRDKFVIDLTTELLKKGVNNQVIRKIKKGVLDGTRQ